MDYEDKICTAIVGVVSLILGGVVYFGYRDAVNREKEKIIDERLKRANILGLENPAKSRDNYERISFKKDYTGDGIPDYIVKFKDGREELFIGRGFERKDISGKVKWTDSELDTAQIEE